jgi:hypothetical protein
MQVQVLVLRTQRVATAGKVGDSKRCATLSVLVYKAPRKGTGSVPV